MDWPSESYLESKAVSCPKDKRGLTLTSALDSDTTSTCKTLNSVIYYLSLWVSLLFIPNEGKDVDCHP